MYVPTIVESIDTSTCIERRRRSADGRGTAHKFAPLSGATKLNVGGVRSTVKSMVAWANAPLCPVTFTTAVCGPFSARIIRNPRRRRVRRDRRFDHDAVHEKLNLGRDGRCNGSRNLSSMSSGSAPSVGASNATASGVVGLLTVTFTEFLEVAVLNPA